MWKDDNVRREQNQEECGDNDFAEFYVGIYVKPNSRSRHAGLQEDVRLGNMQPTAPRPVTSEGAVYLPFIPTEE